MSAITFELTADVRENLGKGANRRLRNKANLVPAIVYGGNEKPLPINLSHDKVMNALEHEAFYSHILTLNIAGQKTKAILKDLQRHHYKRAVMHIDFQRVKENDVITIKVPLHFTGEDQCPGVKAGGIINHQAIDIEVRCKVKDLPEYIDVDVSNLALDHAIRLSEIKLPEHVSLHIAGHNKNLNPPVVSVHLPRAAKLDEEETVTAEGEVAATGEIKEAEAGTEAKGAAKTGETKGADKAKSDKGK